MFAFITATLAFFLLLTLGVWALVLIYDRIKEIRHVCYEDDSICVDCIDDRQRAMARAHE